MVPASTLSSLRGDVYRTRHSRPGIHMQAKTEPALRLATSDRSPREEGVRPRLTEDHVERNPGTALDLDIVRSLRVNRSAVEHRAATIPTRRTVKKEWQAGSQPRAITLIDLTTLAGDDPAGNVPRLCAKAAQPVRRDLLDALGMADVKLATGAVCVYHAMVATAVEALAGTGIPVAAVSTGFPAGVSPLEERVREIRAS